MLKAPSSTDKVDGLGEVMGSHEGEWTVAHIDGVGGIPCGDAEHDQTGAQLTPFNAPQVALV